MNVEQDRRGLKVLHVFDGAPAERGGIRRGDLIIAVNGRSIAGVNSEVATSRIKGPAGHVRRAARVHAGRRRRPRSVKLKRERIDVPVARGRAVERDGRKIGVVELFGFTPGAHGAAAARDQEGPAGAAPRAIVLDLRGNPGGRLTEAVLGVEHLHRGRRDRVGARAATATSARTTPRATPSTRTSRSWCSWTAAARARPRSSPARCATATARPSSGRARSARASCRSWSTLSNGGVLDLTVANYYLPNGETISTKGIKPEVRAEDDPDTDRDEALPVALDTLARELR